MNTSLISIIHTGNRVNRDEKRRNQCVCFLTLHKTNLYKIASKVKLFSIIKGFHAVDICANFDY